MNHTPFDQTSSGSADERKVALQKAVEKMHQDLQQFDKYYDFTKTAILESLDKFEVVLSQMSKLVAIAHEICSDERTQNSDARGEERDSKEKGFTDSSSFSVSYNSIEERNSQSPRKKFRPTLPSQDITIVNEQTSYKSPAGPSTEKNRTDIQIPYSNENTKNKIDKRNEESPDISIIKEPEISLISSPEISKIKDQFVNACKADSSDDVSFAYQMFRRTCAANQRMSNLVAFSQGVSPGGLFKTKDSDASAEEAKNKNKSVGINEESSENSSRQRSERICTEVRLSDGLQVNPHEQDGAEKIYDTDNEAVIIALDKTKGVLSKEDFNSYLFISIQVEDPVQLARVSFTPDIERLYYQLLTFSFNLKAENDRLEKEQHISQTNRKLEERLQNIINAFQIEKDKAT